MRRRAVAAARLLGLAAVVAPARARACEPFLPTRHMVDPTLAAVDQTPPLLAQPKVAELYRNEHDESACMSKCGWDYTAKLTNLATDDMSPANKIGYRLTTAAGTAPVSNTWTGDPIVGPFDGSLLLFFDSGDDFDFTLQVVAIDGAGNESAPQTVRFHSASGACGIAPRPRRAASTLAVVALALAVAAGRRRTTIRVSPPRACGTSRS